MESGSSRQSEQPIASQPFPEGTEQTHAVGTQEKSLETRPQSNQPTTHGLPDEVEGENPASLHNAITEYAQYFPKMVTFGHQLKTDAEFLKQWRQHVSPDTYDTDDENGNSGA